MSEILVASPLPNAAERADALAPVASQPVELVALSRLELSPHNMRRKPPTGIEALAETIAAQGVLQNLVVHEITGTRSKIVKLGVCAGQRRWLALRHLMDSGRIDGSYLVPVKIVSDGEALAASLIENEHERPHPADLCVAFQRLIDEGRTIAYIATLFTIPERAVHRQLKLANVSPKLLDVFRDDGMSYEQVIALALTDDHALQEHLWFEAAQPWMRNPAQLRAAITDTEIDAKDSPLVAFVTLDAYEAAGGHVRRDLFSDAQNAGYVADGELLHRLAAEKLADMAQTIGTEGWSWVEARTKRDHAELARYGRLQPERRDFTKKEKAEYRKLEKARDEAQAALRAYYDGLDDDSGEADDEQAEQLEDAEARAEQAVKEYAARVVTWTDEQKARAGAFVILDYRGTPQIERGFVRPTEKAAVKQERVAGAEAITVKEKPLHSEALCNRLTAHRTAAVQAELIKQPTVALALMMQRLIPVVFEDQYEQWHQPSALDMRATCAHSKLVRAADDLADNPAWLALNDERQKWAALLPRRYRDLLPWLLSQSADVMAELFAFCVAATVDGVSGTDREHAINTVADVLQLDMTRYWKPTRASYLDHVPKQRIVEIVAQAVSPEAANPLGSMKKADAAAAAELRLADTAWLPEVLTNRAVPACLDDDEEADDNA
ncbi:ParB/RepB/Spo0J family partition protein [Burkholderia pseudomallei]|uniref:ParB/RepB/Spo0J family partition protein n=1 Tax=Burkholderia pseudomallei TaxID=28450 RepID=UPI000537354B|nr:ParB/RepB/Spo0J family partition protein [Burkholderia pseudomallei]KGX18364.1 parB-like nuclease domain protein [Burkholderia pseudomallei ABCPW 1]